MGWLMSWLEGIDWEQLLHRVTDSIDTVLVNAVGAVSAKENIVVTASFALIISVYMSVGSESLCHHARTLVCAYPVSYTHLFSGAVTSFSMGVIKVVTEASSGV